MYNVSCVMWAIAGSYHGAQWPVSRARYNSAIGTRNDATEEPPSARASYLEASLVNNCADASACATATLEYCRRSDFNCKTCIEEHCVRRLASLVRRPRLDPSPSLSAMATKLWVVSAPNEGGRGAVEKMRSAVSPALAETFFLPLPTLRVGTLDSLLAVSDAIARDDKNLEGAVDRVLRTYRELAPAGAAAPFVDGVDAFEYTTDFEWDEAKFASSDTLADLRKSIMEQVARIEEDMKIRSNDYSATRQALATIARRSQGNLMARNLGTIVVAEDVVESEHLTTVFVVFPAYMKNEFLEAYEGLAELVVPRSACAIRVDNEYALYGVTVFKKSVDAFKAACRDRRFTVREFAFEPDAADRSADEEARLTDESTDQHLVFLKWAETAFAETFIAMIHLKALRVFVESVLRYGLPVNFEVALLHPTSKSEGRLRTGLNEMYGHLGGSWAAAGDDDATTVPGFSTSDFFPYVYFECPLPKL
jgi:V-type H+-transporting ATPase subunit C